jgi:hypothetical protein
LAEMKTLRTKQDTLGAELHAAQTVRQAHVRTTSPPTFSGLEPGG